MQAFVKCRWRIEEPYSNRMLLQYVLWRNRDVLVFDGPEGRVIKRGLHWRGAWSPVVFIDLCAECGACRCQRWGWVCSWGFLRQSKLFCPVASSAELWSCHSTLIETGENTFNYSSVELKYPLCRQPDFCWAATGKKESLVGVFDDADWAVIPFERGGDCCSTLSTSWRLMDSGGRAGKALPKSTTSSSVLETSSPKL